MSRFYLRRISRRFIRRFCPLLFAAIVVGLPSSAWAITMGQVDNFQDGTTQNWTNGQAPGAVPTANIPNGGPSGADDKFLEVTSTGIGRDGAKLTTFNVTQWSGDYNTPNIGGISMDLKYIAVGDPTFDIQPIRIAFWDPNSAPNEGYASSGTANSPVTGGAFSLPNDGAWHHWTFALTTDAMTLVGGTKTLAQTMSDVTQLRILSSAAPSPKGDLLNVQLGVDNITAIPNVIAGDFNRDGHFNVADVQAMAGALSDLSGYQTYWGLSNSQLVTLGNFNTTDMSVNNLDFQGMITALANGAGSGTLSAVPEPAAIVSAVFGAAALVLTRLGAARWAGR